MGRLGGDGESSDERLEVESESRQRLLQKTIGRLQDLLSMLFLRVLQAEGRTA